MLDNVDVGCQSISAAVYDDLDMAGETTCDLDQDRMSAFRD